MKSGATPPVPVCRRKRHTGTGVLLGPRFRRPLRRALQACWVWAVAAPGGGSLVGLLRPAVAAWLGCRARRWLLGWAAAPSGGSLVGRYGWALFWGRGREVEEALRHDAQFIEHAHHGLDP